MKITRLSLKSFLVVAIAAQFFLITTESVRGQETKPVLPKIIRKSGGLLQGSAIRRVEPVYPPLAKAAKVSGSVVVEVTVDEDGNVMAARALSGHPLLKDSAVAAASQWTFRPTVLSGTPVKVISTITFNFNVGEPPAQSENVVGGVPDRSPAPDSQDSDQVERSTKLIRLLNQSDYRYVKLSEGIWEIEAIGKNIKEFKIRVTMADELVLLIVKLADRQDVAVKNELLVKLLELNHRFDMAKIALSNDMLYARIDVHARIVDTAEFNYAVEQLARTTDAIYPELKPFITAMQIAPLIEPQPEPVIGPLLNDKANSERLKLVGQNTAVDSKPVVLNHPHPRYTDEARNNKVQGAIGMRLLVGTDGTVKDARIVNGLPDGLNEEALRAAYEMKFTPAMKDGKPVAFWIRIDMTFNLR